MEYKVYDCGYMKIHTIKTDKFKNCSMEIMFQNPLVKEHITENNVLVDMLMYSSEAYKTKREMAIALEDLYSASVRGVCTRLGNSTILSFVTDFLNPKYCDQNYLDNVLSFSFDTLLKPNLVNGEFDRRSFGIIKNRIKADIESLKENAVRFAFRRSLIQMDEESPSSYSMVGDINDLEFITPASLIETYHRILDTYTCDIYVIGDLDMDQVVSIIKKKFVLKENKKDKIPLYVANQSRKKTIDVEEAGRYEQDIFVMIYNLEELTKRERDFVIHLFNIIFGNGSLTCKLYKYLREENSLCYNTSSMYQKYDQLLMVYAGINKKDKKKCIKLVTKALEEMQKGNFPIEEVENAKKMVISSLKMSEDSLGGIINNYLFYELDNLPTYDKRIKEFSRVTKEEIMELASKIKLNTIYLLKGEE